MSESQTPVIEARPSWWNFFWSLLFFWLIVVGVARIELMRALRCE